MGSAQSKALLGVGELEKFVRLAVELTDPSVVARGISCFYSPSRAKLAAVRVFSSRGCICGPVTARVCWGLSVLPVVVVSQIRRVVNHRLTTLQGRMP